MKRKLRLRRGFSFIELVIVILLLGVVTAVAAPRFAGSMAGYELETRALELVQDFRVARQKAINQGRSVDVIFDNQLGEYWSPQAGFERSVGSAYTLEASFDDAAQLQFDSHGIAQANGAPVGTGNVRLTRGDRSILIEFDTATGVANLIRSSEVAAASPDPEESST